MFNTYMNDIIHHYDTEDHTHLKDTLTTVFPVIEQNRQIIYDGILESMLKNGWMTNKPAKDYSNNAPFKNNDNIMADAFAPIYFLDEMLKDSKMSLRNMSVAFTGASCLSLEALFKIHELGAKIIACNNQGGIIYDTFGLDLPLIKTIISNNNLSFDTYTQHHPDAIYIKNPKAIWHIPSDAIICYDAQLKPGTADLKILERNRCKAIVEAIDLDLRPSTVDSILKANILYAPYTAIKTNVVNESADAYNTSLFEVKLKAHMKENFDLCKITASKYGYKNHLKAGAVILDFHQAASSIKPINNKV